MVGITLQNVAALIFFLVFVQTQGKRLILNDKSAWIVFSIVGFLTFLAHMCLFYALALGQVVVVSPLASISPFFVLLFVGIFMKKLERVTLKIVIGAVFNVAGAVLLTLASTS